MDESQILILGANGQLGTALKQKYPDAIATDVAELDITNEESVNSYDWSKVKLILNAAAYTNVDGAETAEGRVAAWKVNAAAVSYLAKAASANNITIVHISTEYVFDGTKTPHLETEPLSPLGVYAQTKAAADLIVSTVPNHYVVRTSWVIGQGKNFVRTMLDLAKKGTPLSVISDDIGRPTFTPELVRGIDHLLKTNAPHGTYNLSNDGGPVSWAGLARQAFKFAKIDVQVTDISSKDYYKDKPESSPRPHDSVFDLSKLHGTGFTSRDWTEDLNEYVEKELNEQ